ncbi:MAG: hypothetical protein KBD76_04335 [Bacteriovorax sp.]|nr:hypothetical protein [Bacteriovorax sp.]
MNGTIYDKIKNLGDSKKRERYKLIMALVSTNLLVATLCLGLGEASANKSAPQNISRITHPHYKMLVIPLLLLADINPGLNEIPISLISKTKKILIPKAYLHEEVPTAQNDLGSSPRFKVEIPEEDIVKIMTDGDAETLTAVPEINIKQSSKKTTNKRVSRYEINL